jgi:hypothetical protein
VRVTSGRFRDPLVASHILVGLCAGLFFMLLYEVTAWASGNLNSVASIVVSLSGARFLFGLLLSGLNISAFVATGLILILVLLRSVLRRTWVADAVFVVLMTAVNFSSSAFIPGSVLLFATEIGVLRRFGLLALVALTCANGMAPNMPFTVASWYGALSLTTPLMFAAVAAWALYTILAARPVAGSHATPESVA